MWRARDAAAHLVRGTLCAGWTLSSSHRHSVGHIAQGMLSLLVLRARQTTICEETLCKAVPAFPEREDSGAPPSRGDTPGAWRRPGSCLGGGKRTFCRPNCQPRWAAPSTRSYKANASNEQRVPPAPSSVPSSRGGCSAGGSALRCRPHAALPSIASSMVMVHKIHNHGQASSPRQGSRGNDHKPQLPPLSAKRPQKSQTGHKQPLNLTIPI